MKVVVLAWLLSLIWISPASWAEGNSRSVKFDLKSGGQVKIDGHTFITVRASLFNDGSESVVVSYKDSSLQCLREGTWDRYKRESGENLILPSWSWREAVFILPQGRGENYRATTIAAWKDDSIGLIGPINEMADCRFSMTVEVASLTDTTKEIIPGTEYTIGPRHLMLNF